MIDVAAQGELGPHLRDLLIEADDEFLRHGERGGPEVQP